MPLQRIPYLVRRLEDEGRAVCASLRALPSQTWDNTLYEDGLRWSPHELLAHLVSAERAFGLLIADVAHGGDGAAPDFDVDAFNAAQVPVLAQESNDQLFQWFEEARAANIAQILTFPESALDNQGRHPALGVTTLSNFIKVLYGHVRLHMHDLRQLSQPG
jgi:hypothetical protein